jgi:hypothetical protein
MVFNMKKALLFFILLTSINLTAQNDPVLIIDNVNITFKSGVSLPYWLKAGQTINLGNNAKSASILEFTVDSNNLVFSQAVSLNSVQTVPANKVWKIEGIGLVESNTSLPTSTTITGNSTASVTQLPTIFQSPKKFETPGTFNWKVPPGITSICIEVWGAGGAGGPNGPGGGGGYGYQCFTVVPLTNYIVTVGAGGLRGSSLGFQGGGSSGVENLINVSGGNFSGDGGNGGIVTSSGGTLISINGENSGNGGAGGNGGAAGSSVQNGQGYYNGSVGSAPGGGGGYANRDGYGGDGARGQVYIYW